MFKLESNAIPTDETWALLNTTAVPKDIELLEEFTVPTLAIPREFSPPSTIILLELLSKVIEVVFVCTLLKTTGVPQETVVPDTVPTTTVP